MNANHIILYSIILYYIIFNKAAIRAFDRIVSTENTTQFNFPEALSLLLDKRLSSISNSVFSGSQETGTAGKSNIQSDMSPTTIPNAENIILDSESSHETQNIESFFNGCIMLMKHIKDKDKFKYYYKSHLAKRLLIKGIKNDDDEKRFLEKMKKEFDLSMTSKLEGMFQDVKLSDDLTRGVFNSFFYY